MMIGWETWMISNWILPNRIIIIVSGLFVNVCLHAVLRNILLANVLAYYPRGVLFETKVEGSKK